MTSQIIPYLDLFLEYLIVERGVSKNTVTAYSQDIKDFALWLNKAPHDAALTDIQSYMQVLHHQSLQTRSIARKLSSLRQFYLFLKGDELIQSNPMLEIELPKIGRSLPKILTEDDIMALVHAAYTKPGPEGLRLVCLLELLYATGLRVSELVSLRFNDIQATLNLTQNPAPLVINGKGNKERLVLISNAGLDALKNYCAVRPFFIKRPQQNQWLFPSSSREGYLTRQRFGQLLKDLAITAGIDHHKVSPHIIRHAFASHMLNRGADLLSLQKLLGHADIATTEIYTHVMGEQLEEALLAYHPLSKG